MAQKIYLPKSLGIYNGPRNSGIKGTAIDTDTLDVADWITDAAADGTITIAGGSGAVSSVNARTGAVVLTKSDVSLSNVDNTSDVNKPVSTATTTALNGKASTATVTALNTLSGVAANAVDLGTFTGITISDNVTNKQALQQLETGLEATVTTVGTKQDKIQYKQAGTNVSTSGVFTKVNVIGGTAVANGTDATQLDITIPSGGSTTNTLTSTGSSIVSTVNGVTGSLSPSDGTIEKTLGFNSSGVLVKQTATSASAVQRVINNGADIKYYIVSGTPVVTFTKASGIGTVVATGGVIDPVRVQVNFNPGSESDVSTNFSVIVPTPNSGSLLQYPISSMIPTQNGALPNVTAHQYRNPGSTPVTQVTDGTAGSFIKMTWTGTATLGTSATLVLLF